MTCRCDHSDLCHSYDRGGVRGRCLAQSDKCPCAVFTPTDEESD